MDAFSHIKRIIAIILGLAIALVLKGAVKLIQHPGKTRAYWVHLLWSLYVFLILIHFWWWEYKLNVITVWTFPEYFFIILYITIFYVLCALLYPDDLADYSGYEEYFYSRKNWFFAVLAISFIADYIDTAIKGKDYLQHYSWEYPARNIIHFILCLVAIKVNNKNFHAALVILFILYELSYILRLFLTVS